MRAACRVLGSQTFVDMEIDRQAWDLFAANRALGKRTSKVLLSLRLAVLSPITTGFKLLEGSGHSHQDAVDEATSYRTSTGSH